MTLSDQLRDRIHAHLAAGKSISELARRSGLQQPTLSRFASGQRDLTTELAGKLLESLGGKISWKKLSRK